MATAGERPHVVERPDNWNLQFTNGADAGDTAINPMEIDDVRFESIYQRAKVGALQAQRNRFIPATTQD